MTEMYVHDGMKYKDQPMRPSVLRDFAIWEPLYSSLW